MKKIIIKILLTMSIVLSCAEAPTLPQYTGERLEVNFKYIKRAGLWSNQFASWIEDDSGNYIKTIHVTEGMFKKDLYKNREQALANWKTKVDVNNISEDEIDSFSHATPKSKSAQMRYAWDLKDRHGMRVADGTYKFFVEGTIYKDHYVVYSGTITVGAGMVNTKINTVANYSSDNAKYSDMITGVYGEYFKD